MSESKKVAVIGAGIAGLAHAWSAAERGHDVTLFERDQRASSASIRNFGMVWPIGQPMGEFYELALRSRERWLSMGEQSKIWVNACGSIHLAHREDERDLLLEFCERSNETGFQCNWLTREEVLDKSPAANPENLLGGMYSPTELCVDPRKTIRELPNWLAAQHNVTCEFGKTIVEVDGRNIRSSNGKQWSFDLVLVCSGADFETLFPELLLASDMKRCKLQMLKTASQPDGWRIGPHLASGLTLRHYESFSVCENLPLLKERIESETPELNRYGIHVMASQNEAGEVILGDSHEYGDEIEPFDKSIINDLILNELHKVIRLPNWSISEKWSGIYAKRPSAASFEAQPFPNVYIRTGVGGAGMTMSFGLAEEFWDRISG